MNIEFRMFQDAFPPDHQFGGMYKTSRQAFLSSMSGSAWGAWTVEERPEQNEIIICHHWESNKRVYVDPDREYLFYKTSWGEYLRHDPKASIDK